MKPLRSVLLLLSVQTVLSLAAFGEAAPSPTAEAFRSGFAEKCKEAEKKSAAAVAGADGWYFLSAELRLLSVGQFWGDAAAKVCRSPKSEAADPIPAIVDFQQKLKERGIELLLVPVPPKASIYPEKLLPQLGKRTDDTDLYLRRFYDTLRANGVDVLDLTPVFLKNRDDYGGNGPVFCKTDTHWSGAGCALAAEAIAEKIKSKGISRAADAKIARYDQQWDEVSIDGDLGSLLEPGAPKPEPEKLLVYTVSVRGTDAAVEPDANSPVLILGDSHTLVFHDFLAKKAGLLDLLTPALGYAPDLIGIRGSGATQVRKDLYRRAAKDKDWLAKKKIVVWCFTAREFTEADQGWQKLPVAK